MTAAVAGYVVALRARQPDLLKPRRHIGLVRREAYIGAPRFLRRRVVDAARLGGQQKDAGQKVGEARPRGRGERAAALPLTDVIGAIERDYDGLMRPGRELFRRRGSDRNRKGCR